MLFTLILDFPVTTLDSLLMFNSYTLYSHITHSIFVSGCICSDSIQLYKYTIFGILVYITVRDQSGLLLIYFFNIKTFLQFAIVICASQVQEAIKQSKNNNSQGSDKLNIRHLKYIVPIGLAFLTSMFKTAHNRNRKLANIIPIPNPNKDADKGTSYRPMSFLSVIAKTLEKSLLPYITANIPTTPSQHGCKTREQNTLL